jgi:type VI secretion system protein ImpB
MSSESLQHKLDRVRKPRVQITYDVEIGGAMKKVELPFVVAVFADLSAQRKEALPKLDKRNLTAIDRDNFNDVLSRAAPRLAFKVPDRLTNKPGQEIPVELNFKHFDDFEPARVAEQIPALRKLLEMRQRLSDLRSKLEGNEELTNLLEEVMQNSDKRHDLAKKRGVATDETPKEGA